LHIAGSHYLTGIAEFLHRSGHAAGPWRPWSRPTTVVTAAAYEKGSSLRHRVAAAVLRKSIEAHSTPARSHQDRNGTDTVAAKRAGASCKARRRRRGRAAHARRAQPGPNCDVGGLTAPDFGYLNHSPIGSSAQVGHAGELRRPGRNCPTMRSAQPRPSDCPALIGGDT
jgi:hypothetical protein